MSGVHTERETDRQAETRQTGRGKTDTQRQGRQRERVEIDFSHQGYIFSLTLAVVELAMDAAALPDSVSNNLMPRFRSVGAVSRLV